MDNYAKLGVSSQKEEVAAAGKSVVGNDKGLFPDAFCKINSVPGFWNNFPRKRVKISHVDGAGTKSSLAYLYWKETGDISVFRGVVQDSIVMNMDDLLCIGWTGKRSEEADLMSYIARNKKLIPGDVLSVLFQADADFRANMGKHGVHINGGVGETADLGDLVRTVDIAHSVQARMNKRDVINAANIANGDIIVGLSSVGQAEYETEYNSGMRSNGLTLARHGVFSYEYAEKYPETFDPAISENAYSGSKKLTELVKIDDNLSVSVGKLILSPTRTYAPVMRAVFDNVSRKDIHGIIHCSGGGQTKIGKFIPKGSYTLKNNLFGIPPLFNLIQNETGTEWHEMFKDFNMGCGMEVIVSDLKTAEKIIAVANSFTIDAKITGNIEPASPTMLDKVVIAHCENMYQYC
jgi:phosphoribosylformylglycinamidine cyclo-ligase